MRWFDLYEGKVLPFDLRWGGDSETIMVYENPTKQQVLTAISKADRGLDGFYMRGLCIRNTRLMIWDGWKATHDDILHRFLPNVGNHDTDLMTFDFSHDGFREVKFGDYDIEKCKYYPNVIYGVLNYTPR